MLQTPRSIKQTNKRTYVSHKYDQLKTASQTYKAQSKSLSNARHLFPHVSTKKAQERSDVKNKNITHHPF
jgi:hypothetical protein